MRNAPCARNLSVLQISSTPDDLVIEAQIQIKKLLKQFSKGINTIEVANVAGDERASIRIIVDIKI